MTHCSVSFVVVDKGDGLLGALLSSSPRGYFRFPSRNEIRNPGKALRLRGEAQIQPRCLFSTSCVRAEVGHERVGEKDVPLAARLSLSRSGFGRTVGLLRPEASSFRRSFGALDHDLDDLLRHFDGDRSVT